MGKVAWMAADQGAGVVLTDDEVATLRAATPGTAQVVHLNHAGSSLPSEAVLDTQLTYLRHEAMTGGYEAALDSEEANASTYQALADLIGAEAHEIARTEHATAAWNAAFWAVPMKPGQRIITGVATYGADGVGLLRAAERRGVIIDVIDDDDSGQIDVGVLADRIDDDVALVLITHMPTNGGLINPARAVGALTGPAGIPYLLDACQTVGQLDIDVGEIGCDLLSATGRKYLRGPRGSGFLFASDRIIDRLIPDHPDHHGATWTSPITYELAPNARRFEYWEYNHAAWLALGVAANEALAIGSDRIEASVIVRASALRDRLVAAGFTVMDKGSHRGGIVTIDVPADVDAYAVRAALRSESINVSVATPDSTRFDTERRALGDMMRLSVHYLTTETELDTAVAALERCCVPGVHP